MKKEQEIINGHTADLEVEVEEIVDRAIARREPTQTGLIEWDKAKDLAVKSKQVRDGIIDDVLVEGEDFGEAFPGSTKKNLLKPGAEKITDAFQLYPDYEILTEIESWDDDSPMFYYKIKTLLRQRGSNAIVSTGVGSCNIREEKYWWRQAERKCPECGAENIRKSKPPRKGYYCWEKTGGCGANFADDDAGIVNQEIGKVRNPNLFDLPNTILKIAKKRSHVDAVLNFGFSHKFTQDADDLINKSSEQKEQHADKNKVNLKGQQDSPYQSAPSDNKDFSRFIDHLEVYKGNGKEKLFWVKCKAFGVNSESEFLNVQSQKFGQKKIDALFRALTLEQ